MNPQQQGGQALVWGMLLAAVASVVLVRYFATGQMVAAKARQLHGLDAAAYSGALVQARALNMLALLNRSQVGHQVAMAHLVTLGTWAFLGGAESRQATTGNPPVYLIAMLFGAGHGSAYAAAKSANGLESLAQTPGKLALAHTEHDRLVHHVLGAVQHDIVNTLPQARYQAMQQVLRRHYHGESSSLEVEHDDWPGSIQLHAGGRHLASFVRNVAGRYDFLSPRNHTARNPWPVQARCPARRHELRRRGQTQLDQTGVWQSIDTQSFHALRSNRWIGCYFREYAMGWGWIPTAREQRTDSPHVENPPDDFSSQDFWRWVQEATDWDIFSGDANPLANSRAVAARPHWRSLGLPDYFDVAEGASAAPMGFSLRLRRAGPEGITITTRSAAETFFARPGERADRSFERANLFHPFWQARLRSSDRALSGAEAP
ncbi:hypothetical protein [Pusillimonas noertemannii]|uniref:Flp pilus-assembly TadE/G-like protein n=1 Tax=Pusillimonas noertemannii TaxID=305977 RepID=A0A2U1CK78_9BURK|nr:hypothetical protein [Pusillimonas noertemannii]NYT69680.1 hypothetical protein [Pusillimonas noertemannii]PVY61395.1 hypothetical protein C7440_2946 [Pusillimonas noertemannii]TFL08999.1 hypothetical protein CSC72_14500 [Pusillimonas noertemannii]